MNWFLVTYAIFAAGSFGKPLPTTMAMGERVQPSHEMCLKRKKVLENAYISIKHRNQGMTKLVGKCVLK